VGNLVDRIEMSWWVEIAIWQSIHHYQSRGFEDTFQGRVKQKRGHFYSTRSLLPTADRDFFPNLATTIRGGFGKA